MRSIIREMSFYHVYFAPRGKMRLLLLGEQISQRHLAFTDKLIGIVGDAGSGKSSIIKGMFPGLELVNDDDGINPAKIMQVRELNCDFEATTYHMDMRFQMAFTQMHEIVDFVKQVLERKRRIIIEHFDLLYPHLMINAELIIGIGEEIIVTRPTIFGPLPKDIYDIVFHSVKYRKMAHTAEDIVEYMLENDFKIERNWSSSEVRRGFVMKFKEKPDIDLEVLERRVKEQIEADLSVSYVDEDHIQIGDKIMCCTGPRIHVYRTSHITSFSLLKEMYYDVIANDYSLVGLIGDTHRDGSKDLNRLHAY